jgi:hypothetical protein
VYSILVPELISLQQLLSTSSYLGCDAVGFGVLGAICVGGVYGNLVRKVGQMPSLVQSDIIVVEEERPGAIERCPCQVFAEEVWSGIGRWGCGRHVD